MTDMDHLRRVLSDNRKAVIHIAYNIQLKYYRQHSCLNYQLLLFVNVEKKSVCLLYNKLQNGQYHVSCKCFILHSNLITLGDEQVKGREVISLFYLHETFLCDTSVIALISTVPQSLSPEQDSLICSLQRLVLHSQSRLSSGILGASLS